MITAQALAVSATKGQGLQVAEWQNPSPLDKKLWQDQ